MFTLATRSTRIAWALLLFSGLALPTLARAEPGVCDIDATGMRTCMGPAPCVTRATCIAGAGTDDNTCQPVARGVTSRECLPDCTTMFTCGDAADCPARVNGVAATCSPSANGTTMLPSVCTYTTVMTSVPLSAQISYCVAPGNHISSSQIAVCHRRAGDLSEFTTDYYQGDCDGDGCPNGHDSNPCAADGGCMPATTAFESPFCAPLPALGCTFGDAGLMCGDARPCSPGSTALPCAVGQCEDGWSDVARCRPTCSTLFLCVPGTTAGGGAPTEQCPMIDTVTGVCVPLPGSIAPVDGRTGFCAYSDFFDTSCATGDLSLQCFRRAGDGALTSNYYAGDCDGDGAPNGCDAMRCVAGGGTSMCVDVVGDSCMPSFTPSPDAGVDAGNTTTNDAGTDGGSNVVPDASAPDVGSSSGDASSGIDGGVAAGFSGGGGCRCAAAGVGTRPIAGTALLLLALGLVMRRRARR